jgi:DNA gyrase subunit A
MPLNQFEAQGKGGKGKIGAKLMNLEDSVEHFITCEDHESVLFISNRGIAYRVKAYQIPLASRTARGTPAPAVLPLKSNEKISTMISYSSVPTNSDTFSNESIIHNRLLLLLSKKGKIKQLPLSAVQNITARGLTIMKLGEEDGLQWAIECSNNNETDIIIATR